LTSILYNQPHTLPKMPLAEVLHKTITEKGIEAGLARSSCEPVSLKLLLSSSKSRYSGNQTGPVPYSARRGPGCKVGTGAEQRLPMPNSWNSGNTGTRGCRNCARLEII
jgi:hypothetical protein